jgi:hypothetical protein
MVTDDQNIINRQIIMLQKRLTVTTLAKKINKTRQGVNRVIVGDFKSVDRSADMLDAVSRELRVTKESFWPEFFPAADVSGNNENNQHNTAPQCL